MVVRKDVNIMIIDAKTKGLALLGHPVEHSFSPAIHNAISESLGLNYVYTAHDVHPNSVSEAVVGLHALGYRGSNVTVPHKTEVMQSLTQITNEAKLIGAVNTILFDKEERIGYNTDCYGFSKMLKDEGVDLSGKKVLVLGTGGASRAVLVACMLSGVAPSYICSRKLDKSKAYLESFNKEDERFVDWQGVSYDMLADLTQHIEFDVVINCTPLGMHPHEAYTPVEPKLFTNKCVLVDLIYNPKQTLFLKSGDALGMKTINGLGMLIHQALEAYRIWTGKTETAEFAKKALQLQGVI